MAIDEGFLAGTRTGAPSTGDGAVASHRFHYDQAALRGQPGLAAQAQTA